MKLISIISLKNILFFSLILTMSSSIGMEKRVDLSCYEDFDKINQYLKRLSTQYPDAFPSKPATNPNNIPSNFKKARLPIRSNNE